MVNQGDSTKSNVYQNFWVSRGARQYIREVDKVGNTWFWQFENEPKQISLSSHDINMRSQFISCHTHVICNYDLEPQQSKKNSIFFPYEISEMIEEKKRKESRYGKLKVTDFIEKLLLGIREMDLLPCHLQQVTLCPID